MKSIRSRLIANFIFIILINVFLFEILLITFVRQYYYDNLEGVLTNHIKISSDFYMRYFSNSSLEDNILDNVDVFWKQTSAEVQIIDKTGKVLMDSIGIMPQGKLETSDVKKALSGQKGKWIGNVPYDDIKVMALSYPLRNDKEVIGVIRFISSLREVQKEIKEVSILFIIIGILVILISIFVSILPVNTIIEPVKEVTSVAEQMADGQFNVRSRKAYDDEIGKLSDTLNYMAEEITKRDQLKNEFISSVSHELRTPLTSIKGWAMTLNTADISDDETLKDGLRIIEKESDRLTAMVEELLDFSKFASGKMTIKKRKASLAKVIDYVKSHMSPLAQRNKIDFNVEYEDDLPIIEIDEDRMKQVFINILDNAFKFTGQGGRVTFTAKTEGKSIIISIEDNGCGISREDLPKVKEKFYKGKNSKSQNGIGLSICDEIIKMHNGTFIIDSILNEGTKVTIALPLSVNG